MALKRCKRCKGSKSIMSLGGFEKKCPDCSGIGYEDVPDEMEVEKFLGSDVSDSSSKAKAAPKKKTVRKKQNA